MFLITELTLALRFLIAVEILERCSRRPQIWKLTHEWVRMRAGRFVVGLFSFLIVLASIDYSVELIQTNYAGGDRWPAQRPRILGVGAEGARYVVYACRFIVSVAQETNAPIDRLFPPSPVSRSSRATYGHSTYRCSGLPSRPIAASNPPTMRRGHDTARIEWRMMHVFEAPVSEPVLCAGEEKA